MLWIKSVIMVGQQKRLLTKYGNIPLLIIDEWLVTDISESELYFLFELMERRSDTTSTIFCIQYRKEDWIKWLGNGVRAKAIVHKFHSSFAISYNASTCFDLLFKTSFSSRISSGEMVEFFSSRYFIS